MKRLVVALMVGGVLFAGAVGLAASLDVQPANLGAGGADVVSCDDEVQVWWNWEWSNSAQGYVIQHANVGGINDACNGKAITVTLTKNGNWLAQNSGTVSAGAFSADFTPVGPLASDVTDVHVLIDG